MPKITFIGAGSTVFAKNLLGDILSYPELAGSTISLHDIDPERLRTSEIVARKIGEALGAALIIEATTDRRQALARADYAIAMIQVGGYRPSTVIEFEIPCLVDRQGIQPTRVGALPPQLAARMQTNISVQALTVEAALTGKREHIYHAAMLDPHTAAELDPDQITALVDDLIEAHGDWLPAYH